MYIFFTRLRSVRSKPGHGIGVGAKSIYLTKLLINKPDPMPPTEESKRTVFGSYKYANMTPGPQLVIAAALGRFSYIFQVDRQEYKIFGPRFFEPDLLPPMDRHIYVFSIQSRKLSTNENIQLNLCES